MRAPMTYDSVELSYAVESDHSQPFVALQSPSEPAAAHCTYRCTLLPGHSWWEATGQGTGKWGGGKWIGVVSGLRVVCML